jgi:hypothetical protein
LSCCCCLGCYTSPLLPCANWSLEHLEHKVRKREKR